MEDNEIVKALECCSEANNCGQCEYEPTEHQIGTVGCCNELMKDAFDLINRLQARVEKSEKVEHFADKTIATLQAENKRYKETVGELGIKDGEVVALLNGKETKYIEKGVSETLKRMAVKTAKAEAYKECIEKATNKILPMLTTATLEKKETICFCLDELDNLLKELVGEQVIKECENQ